MINKIQETFKRSATKALTFRFFILVSDSLIVYLITHRIDFTLDVMIFSNLASTIIYLVHERIWNKIHWGLRR